MPVNIRILSGVGPARIRFACFRSKQSIRIIFLRVPMLYQLEEHTTIVFQRITSFEEFKQSRERIEAAKKHIVSSGGPYFILGSVQVGDEIRQMCWDDVPRHLLE